MKRWIVFAIFAAIFFAGWFFLTIHAGTIRIDRGDSVSLVARKLVDAKIIAHPVVARMGFFLYGRNRVVHPGAVEIKKKSTLRGVIFAVTNSKRSALRLTFKEGQDIRDLAELLMENKIIASQAELFVLVGTPARGAGDARGKEGYLFPDTYEISPEGGTAQLVVAMTENFEKKYTSAMRAQTVAAGYTVHEMVTMASILEKEVRGADDRRLVADILWRRAAAGWGLQVDASVNYVTGKSGRFTTSADRALSSPWNTYKYRGLPPGPIGNPGVTTLEAALDPEPNKFWFYLTAPDGTVYYGRTLEEHNANKKYLR